VVAGYVKVAAVDDVPEDEMVTVETLSGEKIVLVRIEDEFYAFQDRCSHKDFPLSNGRLEGDQVECAWHGARFNVRTGRALCLPAIRPVRTYDVRVDNGEIYIAIEDE
jgi:3-phenylpropionate/trans-cinnamate dioxygenase ferredoxin subunit